MRGDIHLIKTESKCFEVIEIVRADIKTINDYAGVRDHNDITGSLRPLGELKVKPWVGPRTEEEDMTDDEGNEKAEDDEEGLIEVFWIEDAILHYCFAGMKLEVIVYTLNIGVKYFDISDGPYCSFYTYLPNEKMAYWKDPVPNTRPAPTEDDSHAEEKVMNAVTEREMEDEEKEIEMK